MTAALLALGIALKNAGVDPSKAIITLPRDQFRQFVEAVVREVHEPLNVEGLSLHEEIAIKISGIKIAPGPRSGLSRTNPPAERRRRWQSSW